MHWHMAPSTRAVPGASLWSDASEGCIGECELSTVWVLTVLALIIAPPKGILSEASRPRTPVLVVFSMYIDPGISKFGFSVKILA